MKNQINFGLLLGLLFAIIPFTGFSQAEDMEEAFSPVELINSHVWDSHEFHITDWKGKPVTMPLPIILWTDNGLTVFSSSKFQHDNEANVVVEANGQAFVKYDEHIFYADKFNAAEFEAQTVLSKPFQYDSRPLDFSITTSIFSMIVSVVLLLLIFIGAARGYSKSDKAPTGLAGFLEPLILFVRDDIAEPQLGHKYKRFMPFLLTVFFFILINNLMGLIPFFPFGANLTGNIAFTFVMAFIVFLMTTFNGNANYWKGVFLPPVPAFLLPIMVPIEIVGMLTKPFALMVRLFANMTAGHIIILSLVSLIFIFGSAAIAPVSILFVLFMTVLKLLVAALQAYIFTLLAALFIGQAVSDEAHE
ncbi:MAG TPA: F0F1 ATP synthase subunit A [Flavobacteriaceae bacterium]|nr:F0F1 ATP synthase subunit A [Flavobacteriaceae bacterium]